jgi:hypothetical protein
VEVIKDIIISRLDDCYDVSIVLDFTEKETTLCEALKHQGFLNHGNDFWINIEGGLVWATTRVKAPSEASATTALLMRAKAQQFVAGVVDKAYRTRRMAEAVKGIQL